MFFKFFRFLKKYSQSLLSGLPRSDCNISISVNIYNFLLSWWTSQQVTVYVLASLIHHSVFACNVVDTSSYRQLLVFLAHLSFSRNQLFIYFCASRYFFLYIRNHNPKLFTIETRTVKRSISFFHNHKKYHTHISLIQTSVLYSHFSFLQISYN